MRLPRVVSALLVALPAVALGGPAPRPLPAEERATVRVPPRPPDWDLEKIRDIFRFADEDARSAPPAIAAAQRAPGSEPAVEPIPGPPAGPRLIGLIRGSEGLKAAIAASGEVIVLGRGESALGYTVIDVDEEGAVVRAPDGDERRLPLESTASVH